MTIGSSAPALRPPRPRTASILAAFTALMIAAAHLLTTLPAMPEPTDIGTAAAILVAAPPAPSDDPSPACPDAPTDAAEGCAPATSDLMGPEPARTAPTEEDPGAVAPDDGLRALTTRRPPPPTPILLSVLRV